MKYKTYKKMKRRIGKNIRTAKRMRVKKSYAPSRGGIRL